MEETVLNHFNIAVSSIATVLIPALISLITVIFTQIRKLKIERNYNANQIETMLKEIELLKTENKEKDKKISILEQQIKELQLENLELKEINNKLKGET